MKADNNLSQQTRNAIVHPVPLNLAETKFAELAPTLPLSDASKEAFQKVYATVRDRDEALAMVSADINAYCAKQVSRKVTTSEGAYTLDLLRVYDELVWRFNSPFLWGIEQDDAEQLYFDCVGPKHCEVAVGTGLLLTKCPRNLPKEIVLVDLNPNTLEVAQQRLSPVYPNTAIRTCVCDVTRGGLDKVSVSECDSIAANFLIHCLHDGPGVVRQVFSNLALGLASNGVFFGSTILGAEMIRDGNRASKAGLATLQAYNKIGVFGNLEHSEGIIRSALNEVFEEVEISRIGYCAIWKARKPKQPQIYTN